MRRFRFKSSARPQGSRVSKAVPDLSKPHPSGISKLKTSLNNLFSKRDAKDQVHHITTEGASEFRIEKEAFESTASDNLFAQLLPYDNTDRLDEVGLRSLSEFGLALHDPSVLALHIDRHLSVVIVRNPSEPSLLSILHAAHVVNQRCQYDHPGCECTFVSCDPNFTPTIEASPVFEDSPEAFPSLSPTPSFESIALDDGPSFPPPAVNPPKKMTSKDLQVLGLLGSGSCGNVFHVIHRIIGREHALKVVWKEDRPNFFIEMINEERKIGQKLSGIPWFIDMCAAWHDRKNLYFLMELYPTSLDNEMDRCGRFEADRTLFYAAELVIAITFLHKMGIIHRDIKAANVLIDREGHLVLADFGLSKDFEMEPTFEERNAQPYYPFLRTDDPSAGAKERHHKELHFVTTEFRGSELEMAPEIEIGNPYSFGVDWYSFGVLVYCAIFAKTPWPFSVSEYDDPYATPMVTKKTQFALTFEADFEVDEAIIDFLTRLLDENPASRLLAHEIPKHAFFTGINWTLMEARMVPAPWVPNNTVVHIDDPAAEVLPPLEPYTDEDLDNFPDFYFVSEELMQAAAAASEDAASEIFDLYSDSDSDADWETVTPLRRGPPRIEEDSSSDNSLVHTDSNSSWLVEITPGSGSPDTPTPASATDAADLVRPFEERWDVTLVNGFSTKPYGPGPKNWFNSQDLRALVVTSTSGLPSSALSAASPVLGPGCVTPHPAQLDFDGSSPQNLYNSSPTSSPDILTPQPAAEAVSNVGILSKIKLWASKACFPKFTMPKRLWLRG